MRRLAREYNQGLDQAIADTQEHNRKVAADFQAAGVKGKFMATSFLPLPRRCPEDLDLRWVRQFLHAFNWRRVARNTAGQYLAPLLDAAYVFLAGVYITKESVVSLPSFRHPPLGHKYNFCPLRDIAKGCNRSLSPNAFGLQPRSGMMSDFKPRENRWKRLSRRIQFTLSWSLTSTSCGGRA